MKRVPYAYVPVYFTRSFANLALMERDVVKMTLDAPRSTLPSAQINASNPVSCMDTQTCFLTSASSGPANISIGSERACNVSVYRAPTPFATIPTNAYAAYSGTCEVTFGSSYYECADYHKITAASGFILRAGFITSGAVHGSMDTNIDASRRSLMSVVAGGAQNVIAAHGYLLEAACIDASVCSSLGVKMDPSFGSPPYKAVLGWALYQSKGSAPPPPKAPPSPSILSITQEGNFYYYAAASAAIVVVGMFLSYLIYRHYDTKKANSGARVAIPRKFTVVRGSISL